MARMNFDMKQGFERFRSMFSVKSRKWLWIGMGVITAVSLFVAIYFFLMPLHLADTGFRVFLVYLALIWSAPLLFRVKTEAPKKLKSAWGIPFFIAIVLIGIFAVMSIAVTPLFMAKSYRDLLEVEPNASFVDNVENYEQMQVPVVDRALAAKLGEKLLGQGSYGSQFEINDGDYNMININGTLYWIAPIEYQGFFQWTNRGTTPGYVKINATDQADVKIELVNMKYVDSGFLSDDLERKMYFANMFRIRSGDAHLEIDDNGNPMYIQAVITKRFAWFGGEDTVGAIITNPVNGDVKYYDVKDVPLWVDRIQPEEIVQKQLSYWGSYVHGFFNTLFAKKDVLIQSTGQNYILSGNNGDDKIMYLQTGMTSPSNDESIVGVFQVDMRTKKASFYAVAGATEYAASQSAEGAVQNYGYKASDPLMINFDSVPTYFMMLKDNEGLVKNFAYVKVADYNIFGIGGSANGDFSDMSVDELLQSAKQNYRARVKPDSVVDKIDVSITEIASYTEKGNTKYIMRLTHPTADAAFKNSYFIAPVTVNPMLALLKAGDEIEISYLKGYDGKPNTISELAVIMRN